MLSPRPVLLVLAQSLPLLFLWGYMVAKIRIHAEILPNTPLLGYLVPGFVVILLYFVLAAWLVDATASLSLKIPFKSRYWEAGGWLAASSIFAGVMNTPYLYVAGACLTPAAVAYYVHPREGTSRSASLIFAGGWGLLTILVAGALLYSFVRAEITTPVLLVAGVVILLIPCLRIYCLLTAWRLSRSSQDLGP